MSKMIVEWFSSEGEMVRYRPLSARLPEFLAVYGPERGFSVDTELQDPLSLKPGLSKLYEIVLQVRIPVHSAAHSSEDSATHSSRIRPLIPVGFGRRFQAIWPDRRRAATWEENCYWLTGVAVNGVRVFRRDSPFKCSR